MGNVLSINKKAFVITTGIGYAFLMALLATLFFSGTILAAFPIGGVGGFVVAADKIVGTDFKLAPTLGQTQESASWPQGAVDLGSVEIDGMELSKEIDVSAALGTSYNIGTAKVVITTNGKVTGQNIKMNITGMVADQATFQTMKVEEKYSNPLEALGLSAARMELENPEINAHALIAPSITLPGMKLKILVYDTDGNYIAGDY